MLSFLFLEFSEYREPTDFFEARLLNLFFKTKHSKRNNQGKFAILTTFR